MGAVGRTQQTRYQISNQQTMSCKTSRGGVAFEVMEHEATKPEHPRPKSGNPVKSLIELHKRQELAEQRRQALEKATEKEKRAEMVRIKKATLPPNSMDSE